MFTPPFKPMSKRLWAREEAPVRKSATSIGREDEQRMSSWVLALQVAMPVPFRQALEAGADRADARGYEPPRSVQACPQRCRAGHHPGAVVIEAGSSREFLPGLHKLAVQFGLLTLQMDQL